MATMIRQIREALATTPVEVDLHKSVLRAADNGATDVMFLDYDETGVAYVYQGFYLVDSGNNVFHCYARRGHRRHGGNLRGLEGACRYVDDLVNREMLLGGAGMPSEVYGRTR